MNTKSKLQKQRIKNAWLFLIPTMAILIAVAGWPLITTIYFGFTNATLDTINESRFIGFENFIAYVDYGDGDTEWIGVLVDPLWWKAVYNTLKFSIVSVILETILGLIVALILHKEFIGRTIVRTAVLVPWAIPTIVSAKMWAWMLNDQFGVINELFLSIGLINEPVAWLADINTAMAAVIMVDVWKTTPFMALLILAALQTLPKDIYEVAKIDKIHPIKQFFYITLPLIKPALSVAIIFRTLDALRVFDLIYVLTPGNEQTITMSIYAKQYQFDFDKFSYGAASSTVLFLIIMGITFLYIKYGKLNLGGEKR
ncbi:carbohydrate ABC transporter permease [Arcobacter sp.]|uniref:carbohydrate ABC transporter permease n=1 Tax=Arcobacter sp. TaxID=1872629 RepID=UPI003D0DC51E